MSDKEWAPDEDFEEAMADAGESEQEEEPRPEYESQSDDEDLPDERKAVAKAERQRLRMMREQRNAQMENLKVANEEAARGESSRSRDRLRFLLRQAEIFQHFMPKGEMERAKKRLKTKSHRQEHAEDEEDAELLKDEDDDAGQRIPHRLEVQPSCIKNGTMRSYQIQGLNWMIHLYDNGINGILADEMGLGKTLQTISLLGYLREFRGIKGPHLVIVPKSTLHNWINEFRKWCPEIRAVKFHGNQEERAVLRETAVAPGAFDVCVTSYEMVIKEKGHFRRFHWRYIIIDEAHRIKNVNSRLSQVVRMIKTDYRLLITGTPLQNNLKELWSLLNFLLPEVFSSAEKFEEWFQLGESNENEAEVVHQLHKLLRPFLLRRLKSDVEKGLPPKKETILKMGLTEMQKKYHAALLQKDLDALKGGADRSRLLNVVMQLRKCCNHPYLFQGAEPGPPYITGEHLIQNSGKMVLLDKLLPKLKERGSRVLIFSQMTRLLDILEDYCLYRGYKYSRIDGNTSGEDREMMIDTYNAPGSEKFIFLLSTRAGGLGINLVTADTVVLYDSDWNPQMDLQAMDRAHRIGQTREVSVFRLCTDGTIEEKVIEKAYKKLRLDALVIQQGRLTQNTKSMNKEELLNMVRYGAERIFSGESSDITDEDIEAIIKKGEKETAQLNDKMKEFAEGAMKFSLHGDLSVYDYKADDEDKMSRKEAFSSLKTIISASWVDPPKRHRKTNYSDTDYFKSTMGGGGGGKKKEASLVKRTVVSDFQFYNRKRINELYDKEEAELRHQHGAKEKEDFLRKQGLPEEDVKKQMDDYWASAPPKITQEERDERDRLLEEGGFKEWTKRDFAAFIRGCERYGREALTEIAKEVEGKTEEEVRGYAKVFWERVHELDESDKIIKTIERGEQRIQRNQDIMQAVARKVARYKNPLNELRIQYGPNKGKAFTEEEDRFLICAVHELGYGRWDELKAEIRKSWRFRFDWFIKSRSPQELQRRTDTLIRLIEKELEDHDGTGKKKESGKRATAEDSGANGSGAKKRRGPAAGAGGGKRAKSQASSGMA